LPEWLAVALTILASVFVIVAVLGLIARLTIDPDLKVPRDPSR
jgi:hypothetical protein